MALARLIPTRNPSARAAAHRAKAQAALFADTSTRTRLTRYRRHMARARALEQQAGLPLFTVYLARSATQLEIHAHDWRDALRRTGRPDACLVEKAGERGFDLTFDPDSPTIIGFRWRHGTTTAAALRCALDNLVCHLDAAAGAGGAA